MDKIVCGILIVGIFLCSADNMAAVIVGVAMLAVGMILAKRWRL